MTIAYNSAYVQTETLNFTFAWQTVIVHFDAECWILMKAYQPMVCCRRSILHVSTVTFLYISPKPPLWSWTWLYHQKANKTTFPTMSCPYRNTVKFWHTSQIHFLTNNTSFCPFKWMGAQMPNNHWNRPFPLRHVDPHLIHQCMGPPHLSPQTMARSLYALLYNCATHAPLVTIGRQKFTPKLPFPFDDHHPI